MDSAKVEKLIGKLISSKCMRLDVSCVTHSRTMFKQLYSGSRNGELSTQFLQVFRDWEILFSHPVERVIRFTDKVRHVIYTDPSSVKVVQLGNA